MISLINTYCNELTKEFDLIPLERKKALADISQYIKTRIVLNEPVNLMYICTHNSRRSHFGQIWAHVAAYYYGVKNAHTFSGGTEETSFHQNAINAIERVGFKVTSNHKGVNPHYYLLFNEQEPPIVCFSKVHNHAVNPKNNFAAIMMCSHAEQNCPFISGAEMRIATTYNDPKKFDNTALQNIIYDERCKQIAVETFYVFSMLKSFI